MKKTMNVGTTSTQVIPPNPYREIVYPIILEPGCYVVIVNEKGERKTIKNEGPEKLFMNTNSDCWTEKGQSNVTVTEKFE